MNYVVKKIITLIITLFVLSFLVFLAFQVISDPATAILGTQATPESVAALRHEMGLDRNVIVQYFDWLGKFLTGDFGTSWSYSLPVRDLVLQKLPVTGLIVIMAFVLMFFISIPVSIFCARKPGGILDHIMTIGGQIAMSFPAFLLGLAFSYLFGILLRLFAPGLLPEFGQDPAGYLICLFFPALALAIPRIAMTVKMMRSSILGQMSQNYVTTAYSRGNSTDQVLRRHVLRNAILPVISFMATSMAEIVAGCILVEQVFAIPGLGVLLLSSIGNRDLPVVQAIVVLIAAWVILVNFIADLLYQLADPRIRLS